MKRLLLSLIFVISALMARSQTAYYWVGGTTETNINTAAKWNTKQDGSGTTRATAASTDILIIDGANIGGTVPTTGTAAIIINTATTAQLQVQNGASVMLSRASSNGVLTIANNTPGQAGLTVDATSTLQLGNPNNSADLGVVYIDLPTSTASIAGTVKFVQASGTGSSSRITCRTTGGVVFASGASISFDNTLAYPFGTIGTATSNSIIDAMVFLSGASLINNSIYSPFGSTAASPIVDFRSGSNYYVRNTITTGTITNMKTFGNLFVQNNATLTTDASTLSKIENLTIDAGATLSVGINTNTAIPLIGNLVVNGTLNGAPPLPAVGTTQLVMGGSTPQTISGTGTINVTNFVVADNANVTLNNNITVAAGATVYGKLDLNTHQINGAGTFASQLNFQPSTGATQTGATLTSGLYQITLATGLGLLNTQGLTITGTGISPGTNIISYSSANGQMNISQPATASATNVTLTFSSNAATLATSNTNGFDGSAGSIIVTGAKTFTNGTNYVINAATTTPVGISTTVVTPVAVGNLTLNANITTNTSITATGVVTLNNAKASVRPVDIFRITGGSLAGTFGANNYIATLTDNTTGNEGVFRYDNITTNTLLPIGSANNYLPVTVNPSATGGGDFSTTVFEGITTNALPGGPPLSDVTQTVNAVWNINRGNGTAGAPCDVTLGWVTSLQGSAFATSAACGISTYDAVTPWPQTLSGTGTIANKTVTATLSSLSSTTAYSVWVTKQNQTITFNPLTALTYGNADVALTATSSNSTIPVTYTSDNPLVATVVSGAIHIVGAGTANITAAQAGNNAYNAATGVVQPLTVNKAPLTVTANNATIVVGDALPTFTAGFTGLVNGDVAANFTVSFTPTTVPTVVGISPIVANVSGANNYTITYVNGTLAVNTPALQTATITFNTLPTKNYGDADLSAAASSNNSEVAIAYQSSNTAVATIGSTGTIHIVGAGTATITASQAASTHFNAAVSMVQTLTVNTVPLTITANNQSKAYGSANPTLTISYTGFVGTDNAASLTTAPTIATTALTSSPVSTYPITVSGAASTNYTISYVAGTLTVNTVPLTITANNQSKAYGSANPILTVAYSGFVNGDTQASLTTQPTVTTTAITTSAAGNYPITAGGAASANYTISYTAGTLNITSVTRVFVFNAITGKHTYGDADLNPGATINTGEPIIYTTSDATVATIVNGLVHITGAGSVTITASIASNPNYVNVQPISQPLTISQATQTINFIIAINLQVGGPSLSFSGLTSSAGLPVTVTSSDPTIASVSGQAINPVSLGIVTITATQAGNSNYLPVTYTQTLEVKDMNELVKVNPGVSPNGDGVNDFLTITGIRDYPENILTIVNRNGSKVFQSTGYNNVTNVFDGHGSSGNLLQAGTYFYELEITVNGETKRKAGYIILKFN